MNETARNIVKEKFQIQILSTLKSTLVLKASQNKKKTYLKSKKAKIRYSKLSFKRSSRMYQGNTSS